MKKEAETGPVFYKPKTVVGNHLTLRNATKEDAAFILALRTDAKKARYISHTPHDLSQQIAWLETYEQDNEQVYFVILDRAHERVGTVRLYDKIGDSFCWGSWILKEGAPSGYAIESVLLVYHFALCLGFERSHFCVRKENRSVCQFHERFGAARVQETVDDWVYTITREAIERSLARYKKYLPAGFSIER